MINKVSDLFALQKHQFKNIEWKDMKWFLAEPDYIGWVLGDMKHFKKMQIDNCPILIGSSKPFKIGAFLSFWCIPSQPTFIFASILNEQLIMLPIKADIESITQFHNIYLSDAAYNLPIHTINEFGSPSEKDWIRQNNGVELALDSKDEKEQMVYIGSGEYDNYMCALENNALNENCLNPYFTCMATAAHQANKNVTQLYSQFSASLVCLIRTYSKLLVGDYGNFAFYFYYLPQNHEFIYVNGELKPYACLPFLPSNVPFDVLAFMWLKQHLKHHSILLSKQELKKRAINNDIASLDAYICFNSLKEGDELFNQILDSNDTKIEILEYIIMMSLESKSIDIFKKAFVLLGKRELSFLTKKKITDFIEKHNNQK